MDLRKIKKLMDMVEQSEISELEVRSGDESVRIVRPLSGSGTPAANPGPAAPAHVPPPQTSGHPLRAPMAGTFYAAPEPDAEPYLCEGQAVQAGDVVCIIESMKMMNEIKAERSGTCTAVSVANGQPVNAGDILFRIT